jgi:hypothetical protein
MNRPRLFITFCASMVLFFSNNTKSVNNQYEHAAEAYEYDLRMTRFCTPVESTQEGVQKFLSEVFNDAHYVQDCLPYSFKHVEEFLRHAYVSEHAALFAKTTLRLFNNKCKACRFIMADTLEELLVQLSALMKPYCLQPETGLLATLKQMVPTIKQKMRKIYYRHFKNYAYFKENPDAFFNELSEDILKRLQKYVHSEDEKSADATAVRAMLVRFLETSLSKIVWDPSDEAAFWKNVKGVADGLTTLMEEDIITRADLDDLFRTLIERTCGFLDMFGAEFSLAALETIKHDIAEGKMLLFALKEQEDIIETRAQRLTCQLRETESRVRARLQGIVTDLVVP